jgi:carbon-monoxide dehydrogenase large subunit
MAAEMPDMLIGHVETPTKESLLGAKGAGEAGTAGAPAVIMNASQCRAPTVRGAVTACPSLQNAYWQRWVHILNGAV